MVHGNESIQHSSMITGKYIYNILCLLNRIMIFVQGFLKLSRDFEKAVHFSMENTEISILRFIWDAEVHQGLELRLKGFHTLGAEGS